jgi:hypothetical protein
LKRKQNMMTKHHVIPRSVCAEHGMSPSLRGNVILKRWVQHRAYHNLFGAVTVWEAIRMLCGEEIDFQIRRKRNAYEELFGRKPISYAIDTLQKKWCGKVPEPIAAKFRKIAFRPRFASGRAG